VRGIIVAGTHSGAGKTTVALGLMAALGRRGLRVQGFKVGPDFIDPGLHAVVTGRPSRNLDGWLMGEAGVRACLAACAPDAEVAIIEGVMGLFDGRGGAGDDGSTAQIARWTGLPVVLVVDAQGLAGSAAALVHGYERFDARLEIGAVLFNRVGTERHQRWLAGAVGRRCRARVLGGLTRDDRLALPERHLGLVTAEEGCLDADLVTRLASAVEAQMDLDALLALARPIAFDQGPRDSGVGGEAPQRSGRDRRCRIAVARDRAFSFYYEENLDRLRDAGAELVMFSPLADATLPPDVQGLYLGGGYPELHAATLAENTRLRTQIRAFAEAGGPIYAECGGFMYLMREIVDREAKAFPMVSLFPCRAEMRRGRATLGYREVRLVAPCPLGAPGTMTRGHEFHYSMMTGMASAIATAYQVRDAAGETERPEGFLCRNVLGTYVHQHFAANPSVAAAFVRACAGWRG
jgi:cobyrinic acid a,c-diamide synthase